MPTNDFLEIATAGGANVQSQAAYVADPVLPDFFADGEIPAADQHGKMFRQTSVIAHMVAQAICDMTGDDMLDNTISATQLASFKKMLQQSGLSQYIADTGAANVLVITPVPAIGAYASGQRFLVKPNNNNTGAATIAVNGLAAKAIVLSNGEALHAGDIPAAGLIEVIYQATLGKFVLTAPATPPYNNTAIAGYFRVPGTPFIVQWVQINSPGGAGSAVNVPTGINWYNLGNITWPMVFPTACLGWSFGPAYPNDTYMQTLQGLMSVTNLGTAYYSKNTNGIAMLSSNFTVIAIGL